MNLKIEFKNRRTKLETKVNIYLEREITTNYKFIKVNKYHKHHKIQKKTFLFINF